MMSREMDRLVLVLRTGVPGDYHYLLGRRQSLNGLEEEVHRGVTLFLSAINALRYYNYQHGYLEEFSLEEENLIFKASIVILPAAWSCIDPELITNMRPLELVQDQAPLSATKAQINEEKRDGVYLLSSAALLWIFLSMSPRDPYSLHRTHLERKVDEHIDISRGLLSLTRGFYRPFHFEQSGMMDKVEKGSSEDWLTMNLLPANARLESSALGAYDPLWIKPLALSDIQPDREPMTCFMERERINSSISQGETGDPKKKIEDPARAPNKKTQHHIASPHRAEASYGETTLSPISSSSSSSIGANVTRPSRLTDILYLVCRNQNREDYIANTQNRYQQRKQELKNFTPENVRQQELINTTVQVIDCLMPLLPTLVRKAYQYQIDINRKLLEQREAHKEGLQHSLDLRYFEEMNSHPNKVEGLIAQVEKDCQALVRAQDANRHINRAISSVQQVEDRETTPAMLDRLSHAQAEIRSSIVQYSNLINLRVNSSNLIQLPYDYIDQAMQAARVTHKIRMMEEATRVQRDYFVSISILNSLASEHNINIFTGVPSYEHLRDYHADAIRNITSASRSLSDAKKEWNSTAPRREMISLYLKSASLYQQAATALDHQDDPNRITKAGHLQNAGSAFREAATTSQGELCWSSPRTVNEYLESASRSQQAAAALDHQDDPYAYLTAPFLH